MTKIYLCDDKVEKKTFYKKKRNKKQIKLCKHCLLEKKLIKYVYYLNKALDLLLE